MGRAVPALMAFVLTVFYATRVGSDQPAWCTPGNVSQAQTTWPSTFVAAGTLDQQDCGQPGCVAKEKDLGICRAVGSIQYNWNQKAMITEYKPCLPLILPGAGSAEACSFHFTGGDLYYLYRDQPIVVGHAPT